MQAATVEARFKTVKTTSTRVEFNSTGLAWSVDVPVTLIQSKIRDHPWTQSVQGAVATWLVIGMRYSYRFLLPSLTRSLPLPVLTVSKPNEWRQSQSLPTLG